MDKGATGDAVVHALAAASTAIRRTLLEDVNNRGEAKAWLISTLAEQQQQQHSATAPRMACFDPCSLPSSSSDSQRNRNDSYTTSHDKIHHSSSSSGLAGRLASTPQQQGPSPIASCKPSALQLLQLLCDAQPSAVAQLLARDPTFLCSCLTASSATTAAWFGQFSLAGIQHFKHGARALANYALTHRSEVWQYLVWAGKHDQAPVAVAVKPHYFAELDIDRTMLALAGHCPEFWASNELSRCCESGEWLHLEPDLVLQELYRLLHEPRSSRHALLRQLISSFVAAADWTLLCNRLLPLLQEQQLLAFARLLAQQQQQQQQQGHGVQRSDSKSRHRQQQLGSVWHWLDVQARYNESAAMTAAIDPAIDPAAAAAASQLPCVQHLSWLVLCPSVQQWSLEQLLLANGLTCRRQQLLSLLQQEDETEQLLQLVNAAGQLFGQQQQHVQTQPAAADSAELSKALKGAAAAEAAVNVQQLVKAVVASANDWPDQQLQLLLVGWLLWLQLLLAAADGPAAADGVLQVFGCRCKLATQQQQPATSAGKQQQQQAGAEAGVQAGHQLLEQPAKQPLRRGSNAAAAAAAADHSSGEQQKRSKKRKKEKGSKQKRKERKKHRRKHSSSSSSGSSEDDSDASTHVKHIHKRRKRDSKQHRKEKKKRHHAHSSSSDSDSSDGGSSSSMDLDAGGELLDPAAFPAWTHSAAPAAAAAAAAQGEAGGDGGSDAAAAATASLRSTAAGDGAGAHEEQQQQLAVVLDALSGAAAGRKVKQHGPWVVQLPTTRLAAAAAAAAGIGSGDSSSIGGSAVSCVTAIDSAAEVLDAAAWYCTWQLMRDAAIFK